MTWKSGACLAMLALLSALVSGSQARLLCLKLRNDAQEDGNMWYTVQGGSHIKYNELTELEWEIWAEVKDGSDEVLPVWAWRPDSYSPNNTVVDLLTGDHLHYKWSDQRATTEFHSGYDTERGEAWWRIRMGGSDSLGINFGTLQVLFNKRSKSGEPWAQLLSSDFHDWRVTLAFETGWWASNVAYKFVGINENSVIVENCTPK